tara:strand:- start:6613 stop:6795 length:183 start_codon:yes stop_codon:yes gene_type:complete
MVPATPPTMVTASLTRPPVKRPAASPPNGIAAKKMKFGSDIDEVIHILFRLGVLPLARTS